MNTSAPAAVAHPPLWPQPIPIIGGTGEKFSGKTKYGLNICPGVETTLVYDLEQSSASYEGEYRRIGVPFVRIDVQKAMYDYKSPDGKYPFRGGYKPIDLFVWWREHIRSVPASKFRVIMVDPITDLERGWTDWVEANPTFFGHTAGQYASMSGMKWGDLKDNMKLELANITAKCETFYFTAHLGAEFQGKTATGKKKIKGKETLYELASMYLWFDRSPDANGVRPNVPSAFVIKGRQEKAELIDGEVISYPILPARMPKATPKAVREYFANPAGKRDATEDEKVKDEVLSADERLKLETAKAEAEATTALARAATIQAQQPTVIITHAPAEENMNSPDSWETNFSVAIDQATTRAELNELKPQIKAARQKQFIHDEHLSRLRTAFDQKFDSLPA